MQNNDWIELVRRIPEEQHNKLVITTLTGVDLNVELILRMDETFFVFRGRISGITEEGRVFFVPYRQIDFLQINRQVKEAEIHALFSDEPPADTASPGSGIFAAPSGVFNAVAMPGSNQGASISPATPFAPAQVAPSGRPALPGITARLSSAGNSHGSKIMPPPPAVAEGPTPPRNSILERLRAQRNSVVQSKPLGR